MCTKLITFDSFEMSHRHPNVCETSPFNNFYKTIPLVGIVYHSKKEKLYFYLVLLARQTREEKKNIQIVGISLTYIETAHSRTKHQSNLFSAKVPFASRISFWNLIRNLNWEKCRACRKSYVVGANILKFIESHMISFFAFSSFYCLVSAAYRALPRIQS